MKRILSLLLSLALLTGLCAPALAEAWSCPSCGAANERNFCTMCGEMKPEKPSCAVCGFEPEAGSTYKFCPECGTKFPGAVTPTPKPEPTEKPAEGRSFYISSITTHSQKASVIEWVDSAGKGPYKLCYEFMADDDYDSEKQMQVLRFVVATNIEEKSAEVEDLLPGVNYWITVFDAEGTMAKLAFRPFGGTVPFDEFDVELTLKPAARTGEDVRNIDSFSAADILAGNEEYGMFVEMRYEAMKATQNHFVHMGVEAPDGTMFTIHSSLIEFEEDTVTTFWSFFRLERFFGSLKNEYDGEIPKGEYTLTLYIDRGPAATQTFTIR